ncbi:GM16081 [Drosophila sechellia]|uniref:GM16081 n=1 Tax=Drosophila sechellia TaxID=7238 RepID=B4HXQ3_DROSE|nr:GM16081 [Drosophila sechellia]
MGMCPESYLALFFRSELSALECAKRERFVQIYLAQLSHPKIHSITRQPSSE